MDAETAGRLPDLLAEVLARPPLEWDAFLAAACGNDLVLRAEVLALASQQTASHGFLETPAYVLPDAAPDDLDRGELKPGETLGDCKILELIGEGGMGEVYLAEDIRLERRVAVKLLKRHLHDTFGQRFRQEQRVLAGLTHPGIARLYNAAVDDGRAYLVMEYVEGERLDVFCDRRRLSTGERLVLFRKVCAAVAYAHQNLVIHRDLKPANIRVTPEGEPKLLDFGIAKLIDPQADQDTAQTVTQDGALTPGYASPEQLRGEAVTTATDTYSLGVVLYELLCGRRPFDPHRRRTGDPGRANREEAVLRPGGVVPTAEAADARAATPRRLARQLAGDLDNIVLLAMRFEPARRYPSVSQLSEDIRRHLEGQPVAARKETLRYVGAKFMARNKALTAAAALVLLTLLGGIVATTWQAHVADEQRRRADRRFDDVRRLADSLMGEINDSVQTLAGSTSTQKLIVTRALEYLDNLSKEADVPALRLDLAAAYEKIGNVQGNPYYANLGDTGGAMASYRKAQRLLEPAAVAGAAAPTAARLALGRIDRAVGDIDEANGDYAGTIRSYRASLDVFVRLAQDQPSDPAVTDELSRAYGTLGDGLDRTEHGRAEQVRCFEQALASLQKLLAVSPDNRKYQRSEAVLLQKLGRVTLQDKAHGIADITRGVAGLQALCAVNPDNARARREYAVGLLFLGEAQMEVGDPAGAVPNFQKSLTIREQVAAADPADEQAQFDLAATQSELSEALTQTGQPEASLAHGALAVAVLVKMLAAHPGSTKFIRNGGIMYKRIGNAHAALAARASSDAATRLAHWTDAQTAYEQAQKLFADLSAQGIVRTEDSDMSEKLTVSIAKCREAIAQLKK